MLVDVFKIYHTEETKADQVEMLDAKVALANIADKVLDTYNTNEEWVVKNMRSKYVNIIIANFPIIYQKDKV
jgi:hypothetical protein